MKKQLTYLLVWSLSALLACNSGDKETDSIHNDPRDHGAMEEIALFPPAHPLNEDISSAAIDTRSTLILNNIGLSNGLFPDFGSGTWEGAPIGIPYVVVGANQQKVPITFRKNDYDGNYGDESDQGPFPIPLDAPIEGNGKGDSHVIAVDVDNKMLYELYNASRTNDGWAASSAAAFALSKVEYRPEGWTSADAAGLPILPLLIRYEEILKGEIDHALRFTLPRSKIYEGFVHPAQHQVSGNRSDELLPFGGRLRLRSDFDMSTYSKNNRIILTALKKYGLILADVGSSMFLTGAPDERWDNDDLKELKNVKVSDFEVIEMNEIRSSD